MSKIIVLTEEPLKNISAIDFKEYFKDKKSEQDIADAFANSSNKFFWLEDEIYDYEEGTTEFEQSKRILDDWCEIMDYYENKIINILNSEGIVVPNTGRITVFIHFMEKYGYINGDGWWIKR